MTDIPLSSGNQQNEPVLGPREEATRNELYRRETALADLYASGMLLAKSRETGSTGYLLAHAGRELGRGLLASLAGGPVQIGQSDEGDQKENNRLSIASALELGPQHGLVTEWFQLNNIFSTHCHYRPNGIDTSAVKTAFLRFSDLIYGLLAPYFDTEAELDRLLGISTPTTADVELAAGHLVRPQQRRYFFEHLQYPAWLEPLAERGLFDAAPDRIVHADDSWQMRPWPEGKYLARIAAAHPRRVVELFSRVPKTLANPAVWMTMIDAALVLPPEEGGLLALHIAGALQYVPPVALPHQAIGLVVHLANRGQHKPAIRLADELLTIRSDDSLQDRQSSSRARSRELLRNFDDHDLEAFLKDAVPALFRLDAALFLHIMLRKLNKVVKGIDHAEATPGETRYWCSSLDQTHRPTDARQMLAASIAHHAGAIAQASDEGAALVWKALRKYDGEIFQRIKLRTLADAGSRLQEPLDKAVGSDLLLDPPYGAREAALLLRTRFSEASPYARRLFAYALARGPATEDADASASTRARLNSENRDAEDVHPTEGNLREAVQAWQARRLRWFHSTMPSELKDLASQIGVVPENPSRERQDLDEVGFHSGGAGWMGRKSPKSAEELGKLTTDDLLDFLATWEPTESRYEGPSYGGLHDALTAFATQDPDAALRSVARLIDQTGRPGYATALLAGITKRTAEVDVPSWTNIVEVVELGVRWCEGLDVETLLSSTGYDESASPAAVSTWHQFLRTLVSLLEPGCTSNLLEHNLSPRLWNLITSLVDSNLVWLDTWVTTEDHSLSRWMMAGLNTAGGEVTQLLIQAALWEYRETVREHSLDPDRLHELSEVESKVAPLLKSVFERTGDSSNGARTIVGRLLPQVRLVAPSWVRTMSGQMFDRGSVTPIDDPVFGTYLAQGRFYDSSFAEFRETYVHAARTVLRGTRDKANTSDDTASEGLVLHVMIGIIRGLISVTDDDGLAELTFTNALAKEIAHGYWEIFRGWSDTVEAIPEEYIQRLTAFWEWRIQALEALPDSLDRQMEAEGFLWLFTIPQINAADAIRLGLRSLRLNTGESHARFDIWERIVQLAEHDPGATLAFVELLVNQELTLGYGVLPFDRVGPPLRTILERGSSDVKARAIRLVHHLGEKGHPAFKQLLMGEEA